MKAVLLKFLENIKRFVVYPILYVAALIAIFYIMLNIITEPSNGRRWNEDQSVLSSVERSDNLVTIHNIRNFTYESTTNFKPAYYDKTLDLGKIKRVWYIVEPFSGFQGSAHTFLSFEFEGKTPQSPSEFVAISIEIRKEVGETFSALKGMANQYELMYVIADERDVIKLRSNYRKDQVFVYPIKSTPQKVSTLFIDMLNRANELKDNPEFYNTLYNNCTINIARHVNTIAPDRLPWFSLKFVLPAESDKLAYDLNLLDTTLPFAEARQKYLINDRAMQFANDPNFSQKIRE
jgi:hypothetical protein